MNYHLFNFEVAIRKRRCHKCGATIQPGEACLTAESPQANKINCCEVCLILMTTQVQDVNEARRLTLSLSA